MTRTELANAGWAVALLRRSRRGLTLVTLAFLLSVLASGCAPAARLAFLDVSVTVSNRTDTKLDQRLQMVPSTAGVLPVSVTFKNVTARAVDLEDVTALIANADGGPLAHRSIAKRVTVQPNDSERRQLAFTGAWPDDAVLVVQVHVRNDEGKLRPLGSCTPLCASCDIERTERACAIELGTWLE